MEAIQPIVDEMTNLHNVLMQIPDIKTDEDQRNYEMKIMEAVNSTVSKIGVQMKDGTIGLPFATFTLMGMVEMLASSPVGNPQKIMEMLSSAEDEMGGHAKNIETARDSEFEGI